MKPKIIATDWGLYIWIAPWDQKIAAINSSGRYGSVGIAVFIFVEKFYNIPLDRRIFSACCYSVRIGVLV